MGVDGVSLSLLGVPPGLPRPSRQGYRVLHGARPSKPKGESLRSDGAGWGMIAAASPGLIWPEAMGALGGLGLASRVAGRERHSDRATPFRAGERGWLTHQPI